jgi:hypothetical protein
MNQLPQENATKIVLYQYVFVNKIHNTFVYYNQ